MQAFAESDGVMYYSASKVFTTLAGYPILEILDIAEASATQFTVVAYVFVPEDVLVTRRGLVYNTTGVSPLVDSGYITKEATHQYAYSGEFTDDIKSLSRNTTYYVWAFAEVGAMYYQSARGQITTTEAHLTFDDPEIVSYGISSATFAINLLNDGGIPVTWMGVMWSRTEGGGWNQLSEEWDPGVFRISIPPENIRKRRS